MQFHQLTMLQGTASTHISLPITHPDDVCAAVEAASSAAKDARAEVDALLARLPALDSRAACDELAVSFCYINSKAARRRLVRVPHGNLRNKPCSFRVRGLACPPITGIGVPPTAVVKSRMACDIVRKLYD